MMRTLTALMLSVAVPASVASAAPRRAKVIDPTKPKIVTKDPTGIYQAQVNGYITASNRGTGYFNFGTWTLQIRSQRCLECVEGQYYLTATLQGITYTSGFQEKVQFDGFYLNSNNDFLSFVGINPILGGCPTASTGIALYESFERDSRYPGQILNFSPTLSGPGANIVEGRIGGLSCYGDSFYADVRLVKQ